MTAPELLERLRLAEISIDLRAGTIHLRPRAKVTEEITAAMIANRDLVVWALERRRPADYPFEAPLSDADWQHWRQLCDLRGSREARLHAA
jgi:hypothetical protein